MASTIAARSVLRSATRTTAVRLTNAPKTKTSPSSFVFPTTHKPLSARIFRSPVEMSCLPMLPYHTATACALLTSMLSVAPRTHTWILDDCNDDA